MNLADPPGTPDVVQNPGVAPGPPPCATGPCDAGKAVKADFLAALNWLVA